MSSNVKDSTATATSGESTNNVASQDKDKGKGKAPAPDQSMEEDDEEEDEEEEDEEEDEDEDEGDENFEEINPALIISGGRRTRGVKVDYTSKEALAKAGLQENEVDEDGDEDVVMKD